MKINNRYKEALAKAKETPGYWIEKSLLDVAGRLLARMKELGVSQKDLADKMGKKAPYINRVLSGKHNVTIETLGEAAFALGMTVDVSFQPIRKEQKQGLLTTSNEFVSQIKVGPPKLRIIKSGAAATGTLTGREVDIRKAA